MCVLLQFAVATNEPKVLIGCRPSLPPRHSLILIALSDIDRLFRQDKTIPIIRGLVGKGCRIYWLHLCRGVRLPYECPGYNTKQSDGEASVMLELLKMQSTTLLPSLPGPLEPGVVVPDRVLSMGQIELDCLLMLNWIVRNRNYWHLNSVFMLNWIVWNRTVFDI